LEGRPRGRAVGTVDEDTAVRARVDRHSGFSFAVMLLRLVVARPAALRSAMLTLAPIFFVLAAPVAAASPSPAPQTSPAPAHSEYVEVTAKGLHEEVETVPAMVTVIGGEEARARNADDLRAV